MKKIILTCVLATIYLSSFAQTDSVRPKPDGNYMDDKYKPQPNKNVSQENPKQDSTNVECAMKMLNGKMMMMVDGKMAIMDKEMVMEDGTIVMMDGTVKRKDGKTLQMKEGDCIDISGRTANIRTAKQESR